MTSVRTQVLKNAKRRVSRKSKRKVHRPNKGQEKRVVNYFRHLGKSEVKTPLGRIDLLTDKFLLEFKVYGNAKEALGQVLTYSHYHPRKYKMVVLFGRGLATWKGYNEFVKVAAEYDVHVYKLSASCHYRALLTLLENAE